MLETALTLKILCVTTLVIKIMTAIMTIITHTGHQLLKEKLRYARTGKIADCSESEVATCKTGKCSPIHMTHLLLLWD